MGRWGSWPRSTGPGSSVRTRAALAASLLLTLVSGPPAAAAGPFPDPPVPTTMESGRTYGIALTPEMMPSPRGASAPARYNKLRLAYGASGTCWLRTDIDADLARAVGRFGWLGSTGTCPTRRPHLRILGILDYHTLWSAPQLCRNQRWRAKLADRFTLGDWRRLVRCVATRFKGRIEAYEIWNEPLLNRYGYQDRSASHYLDLLRVASQEIRRADRKATIVAMGGVDAYAGGDTGRVRAGERFSEWLADHGAARYADAVSVHAYDWGEYGADRLDAFAASVRFHRRVWGLPVWVTETGHRTLDSGTQAGYIDAAYGALLDAGARRVFWFALRDDPAAGPFGIAGRPAQAFLSRYIAAAKTGLLRVATDPAVPSTITVTSLDVSPRQRFEAEWGVDWARIQAGRYRIEFASDGVLPGGFPAVMPAPVEVRVGIHQVTQVMVDPRDGSYRLDTCWEDSACP